MVTSLQCYLTSKTFIAAILFITFNAGVSSFDVVITPKRAHISKNTNLTVMCRAGVPLVGCQFKHGDLPMIELSRGHDTNSTDDYRYFGNGLQQGECGVVFNSQHLVNDSFHFVDCRVRSLLGGWVYRAMEIFITGLNPLNIIVMPPLQTVVVPGSNVSLFVKADTTLTKCKFRIPSLGWINFGKNLSSNDSRSYRYFGEGLQAGDCGVTFINARQWLNGLGFISIEANNDIEILFIRFVFAKPPQPPELEVTLTDVEVKATCTVRGGQPWGNITWFLGDELMRQDEENEADDEGVWKPLQLKQTFSWKLRQEDFGKYLRCVVTHLALSKPLEAKSLISKLPRSLKVQIEPRRAHISENAYLVVMCRASEPIVGCQFKHGSRPVIDFSHGIDTNSTDDYLYRGNGLLQGDCGVQLNTHHLVNVTFHSIKCRVRSLHGGWIYRAMDVYVTDFMPINILKMPPQELVVLPGDNSSLLVKVDSPLIKCKLLVGSVGLVDFTRNATAQPSKYRYHGNGLQRGECGITVFNATEELAGVGFVSISTTVLNQEIFFTSFYVAKPPQPPELEVTSVDVEVKARCTVRGGTPWGNISWFIGEDLVRQDEENEADDEGVWKPSRRQQSLRWKLRQEDFGKYLRCVVTHLALSKPLEAKTLIIPTKALSPSSSSTNKPANPDTSGIANTSGASSVDTKAGTRSADATVSTSRPATSTSTLLSNGSEGHTNFPQQDDDKMNSSLLIGLVVALLASCLAAAWIYAWFNEICCFAHSSTREVRHGQIGMSKLLEKDDHMESVTASSYVGLDA